MLITYYTINIFGYLNIKAPILSRLIYVLLFLCVFFLIQGICYFFSPRDGLQYKLFGFIYCGISIVLMLNTNLSVGYRENSSPEYRQLEIDEGKTGCHDLHKIVVGTVKPMIRPHIGLVVGTVAQGKEALTGFGSTTLSKGDSAPCSKDTVFEVGSITKVFTASILAQMITQQEVSLSDTLKEFTPFEKELNAEKEIITLEHLVTHTSGLPKMGLNIFRPAQLWALISGGNPYSWYTKERVIKTFSGIKLKSKPSSTFQYSNIGFGLLSTALCSKTGKDYAQLIQEKIAGPLELKDTSFYLDRSRFSRLASGYQGYIRLGDFYIAQKSSLWDFASGMSGAGGLRSSGQDMLRFLNAQMGHISTDQLPVFQMAHKVLHKFDDTAVGMGWLTSTLPGTGKDYIFHDGISGGYASFIGMTSDYQYGVVILSNTAKPVVSIGQAVLNQFIRRGAKKES